VSEAHGLSVIDLMSGRGDGRGPCRPSLPLLVRRVGHARVHEASQITLHSNDGPRRAVLTVVVQVNTKVKIPATMPTVSTSNTPWSSPTCVVPAGVGSPLAAVRSGLGAHDGMQGIALWDVDVGLC
jgi:hypothetical protein